MFRVVVIVTLNVLLFFGCKSNKNIVTAKVKAVSESSLPVYKTSINGMINLMEDDNRDLWQKPEVIIDAMGNINTLIIYDLGAGTGYFSTKFVSKGANVIAAEPDPRFFTFLKNKVDSGYKNKIELRQIPFENPILNKQEVDWVFCANTYQLISNRVEYFSEVKKGLKKNGRLILVNHKKIESPNGPPKDKRISPEETINELNKSGYHIEKVDSTSLPENYIIIAK
jgi:SAM-dependent methyltransferase